MTDRTYTISAADLENIERSMHDLSDLVAPLRDTYPQGYREGCMVVARLDRVIQRAQDQKPQGGDAA